MKVIVSERYPGAMDVADELRSRHEGVILSGMNTFNISPPLSVCLDALAFEKATSIWQSYSRVKASMVLVWSDWGDWQDWQRTSFLLAPGIGRNIVMHMADEHRPAVLGHARRLVSSSQYRILMDRMKVHGSMELLHAEVGRMCDLVNP